MSSELFLNELRKQYEMTFQFKENLEAKANNLVTISGTVATLLFGLGLFLIEKLGRNYEFVTLISVAVVSGVLIIIASMLFGIWSFTIKNYRFAMRHSIFYNANVLNDDTINLYKGAQLPILSDTMIKAYLRCIKQNSENNKDKADKIRRSQWLFTFGILLFQL